MTLSSFRESNPTIREIIKLLKMVAVSPDAQLEGLKPQISALNKKLLVVRYESLELDHALELVTWEGNEDRLINTLIAVLCELKIGELTLSTKFFSHNGFAKLIQGLKSVAINTLELKGSLDFKHFQILINALPRVVRSQGRDPQLAITTLKIDFIRGKTSILWSNPEIGATNLCHFAILSLLKKIASNPKANFTLEIQALNAHLQSTRHSYIPFEGGQLTMMRFNNENQIIDSFLQIINNVPLLKINLSQNCFTAQGLAMLLDGLAKFQLQELSFVQSHFKSEHFEVLAKAIPSLSVIRLNISANPISRQSALLISESLKKSNYLKELDLYLSNLDDESAVLIAEGAVRSNLETLALWDNPLSNQGLINCVKALQGSRVKKIAFTANRRTLDGTIFEVTKETAEELGMQAYGTDLEVIGFHDYVFPQYRSMLEKMLKNPKSTPLEQKKEANYAVRISRL